MSQKNEKQRSSYWTEKLRRFTKQHFAIKEVKKERIELKKGKTNLKIGNRVKRGRRELKKEEEKRQGLVG